MGINKVQINKNGQTETIIDLTQDTVTEETLLEGVVAHGADGEPIIGTFTPKLQDKTVTPTTSVQTVEADSNYDGLNTVTVNAIPDSYIQPSGSLEVTENGTHDVTSYASVEVNVPSGGSGSGGGSDSGIQYEVITIPAGATSATYTLPRVTNGAGTMYYGVNISAKKDTYLPIGISDTHVLYTQSFSTGSNAMVTFEYADVYYDQGTITWEAPAFKEDLTLVLVNDPSKDPLWTCTPS